MRTLIAALALGLAPSFALANEVNFKVVDQSGSPVANAVIKVDAASSDRPMVIDMASAMAQEDRAFKPHVLVVPVGTLVSFPNRDRFRHHVYSFSKGNRFELELYGKDESRSVTFDKPGLVAIGCNIHDDMIGYIHVIDAARAGRSNDTGDAAIDFDGTSGEAQLWLPDQPERWIALPAMPDNSGDELELRIDRSSNTAEWRASP